MWRSREGDYLEDLNRIVFDVKGLVHPSDRIIAFPRFIPDPQGTRLRTSIPYKKVYALSERFAFLQAYHPHYLVLDPIFGECLCEIPQKAVVHHYDPITRLERLRRNGQRDQLETDALHLLETLHDQAGTPWRKLGVSGSLLIKMHTPQSDIDPIIYGARNCIEVHEGLRSLAGDKKSVVKPFSPNELRALYGFRFQDTRVSFSDFIKTERRKILQGKFLQHDYFIRCIRSWDEIGEHYGDVVYRKIGYARIKAVVSDDAEAIFTPCRYTVKNVQLLKGDGGEGVTEIASFRGRFCEQARTGETVVAQGKVENVQKRDGRAFVRLLLGGQPSDFMVLEE